MNFKILSAIILAGMVLGAITAMHIENRSLSNRLIGCSAELKTQRDTADRYKRDMEAAAEAAAAATRVNEDMAADLRRRRNAQDGDVAPVMSDTLRMLNDIQIRAGENQP